MGLDISAAELSKAALWRVGDFVLASATSLPFGDGVFQTVLMLAVIEHLPDPSLGFAEVARVLRPGGRLVATTPTPAGGKLHHLMAKVGLTAREASEQHVSVLSPTELRRLVEGAGHCIEYQTLFQLGANQLCVAVKRA